MYSEGIVNGQRKLICSDCKQPLDSKADALRHGDPMLKYCPGRFQSTQYTAIGSIARGK